MGAVSVVGIHTLRSLYPLHPPWTLAGHDLAHEKERGHCSLHYISRLCYLQPLEGPPRFPTAAEHCSSQQWLGEVELVFPIPGEHCSSQWYGEVKLAVLTAGEHCSSQWREEVELAVPTAGEHCSSQWRVKVEPLPLRRHHR